MKKPYLECGKIINTHGVHGMVKIEPYCDGPEVLASLSVIYTRKGTEYTPRRLRRTAIQKQFVLAEIEGVTDFDGANALRNTVLYAAREDIPLEEGSHFIADLIGLPVIDEADGTVYGKLNDVRNFGAQDIYMVGKPDGTEFMIPVVDEFIRRVDDEEGIFVRLIEGML